MSEQAIEQLTDSTAENCCRDDTGFIGVVELNNYQDVLRTLNHDLLLAFIRRDEAFPVYFEKLVRLESKAQDGLKIRIVAAGSEDELMRIFGVGGTPAFLLFRQGIEVGRSLGDTDPGRLFHNV